MFERAFQAPTVNRENIEEHKKRIYEDLERKNDACDQRIRESGFMQEHYKKFVGAMLASSMVFAAIGEDAAKKFIEREKRHFGRGYEVVYYTGDKKINPIDHAFESGQAVAIDEDMMEKTKEHWKNKYAGGSPDLADSLVQAYSQMEHDPVVSELKQYFEEHGVPEKYVYLAIPESHWNSMAASHAGAKGAYQFMAKTARDFGLRVDKKIDERKNPLKSGMACGDLLKDNFDKLHDWDLAVSAYNGSKAWEHGSAAAARHEKPAYGKFLTYVGGEWKKYLREYQTGRMAHEIKKGDTLEVLAKKYHVTPKAIKIENRLKSSKLEPGQVIHISIRDNKVREHIFQKRKQELSENINYVPKFKAVSELIEEGIKTQTKKG